ncbi:MAG TPA: hypothetical protein VLB73_05115 [Patescibacteria group bacterium]|nr:hypothetical protein [Patescibacteria group bacterium]
MPRIFRRKRKALSPEEMGDEINRRFQQLDGILQGQQPETLAQCLNAFDQRVATGLKSERNQF